MENPCRSRPQRKSVETAQQNKSEAEEVLARLAKGSENLQSDFGN